MIYVFLFCSKGYSHSELTTQRQNLENERQRKMATDRRNDNIGPIEVTLRSVRVFLCDFFRVFGSAIVFGCEKKKRKGQMACFIALSTCMNMNGENKTLNLLNLNVTIRT